LISKSISDILLKLLTFDLEGSNFMVSSEINFS